nr:immunoglobulin heavy chain junction region [Mus musculus]
SVQDPLSTMITRLTT